ncbi:DUF1217 domain-containing protein [Marivita sp. GX14005]|uniref:DUF1217 domain-containing protein n=1 Tax=Marivita sp. GX14005 TaxID=2942276 RepID=UPI0020184735|nr:DUF1217 domain-containing protein [Marivita sp. GX14005]MCL3882356.1 DUF1217 domain-containing protein [Marivita sp. GX14005]
MTFSPTVLGSGPAGYAFLQRTRADQQASLARSPDVARNIETARDRLGTLESADQLLNNRALLTVALGAFGLDEDIQNRAFIEKVLTSDLSDDTSLANKLADKRYRELAETFNFFGESARLPGAAKEDRIRSQLAELRTADDLLTNPPLLRATLERFGLESDRNNLFFLQRVLESDLADNSSFANRLSDPRYAELAGALGFAEKRAAADSIYGFADRALGKAADLQEPSDLLGDTELLAASLRIFGLQSDLGREDFLTSVLSSDLSDDSSFANQLDDPRYAAWSDLFGFAERAAAPNEAYVSKLQSFVETVASRETPPQSAKDFLQDAKLMLKVFDFFGLPLRSDSAAFANRLIASDKNDPTSLINVLPDPRLKPFVAALNLPDQQPGRSHPPGFADAIVDIYVERQFEIRIGEADPNMRLALGLNRDLAQVVAKQRSNDAQWFAVLASNPLREVFETALNTPDSFNRLDIDRQVEDLKIRANERFGTDRLSDFTAPETLDALRERFLLFADLPSATTTPASALLGGGASGGVLPLLYGR